MARITTPKTVYTMDYPTAVEFADKQMDVFWHPNEINIEKDVQDLRVNMTPAETHGVVTTLKLFTLYELLVGNEYWAGRIKQDFPRPDIEFMATTFGFMEISVHARFYSKLNEALMLDTDEFYESYINDETLSSRIAFVNKMADDKDTALAVAVFSMLEGAVLYSSFAFLKHFQSQGKNKLKNVCSGINFSVRDENLHALAGAWLFNTLCEESGYDEERMADLHTGVVKAAETIYEHESRIVDMIFEKGQIDGIKAEDLKTFIKSRINLCLTNLNMLELYEVKDNPVAEWFYKGINAYSFGDFFYGVQNEYNRTTSEEDFEW
ncbi:ribonucleotide-diphosphate reductase subunit beta [Streptomyces sp. NPDC002120]|uniref:ribonucleotide-diphosphate reductase subunit beta n=1 Tax=Streptomyces sp. NPDC002120 TaxID=3364631 RepID=UPI003694602B